MEGECEVCGRSVNRLVQVTIEGSVVEACPSCSRLGEKVPIRKPRYQPSRVRRRAAPAKWKEPILEPIPGYGEVLRERRLGLGLTQEELGKRLNEKASVVARLEAERMTPSEALAKKIERHLGVRILEKVEENAESGHRPSGADLTLGDIVKIKRRRT
jgi:putative transcription factor